MSIALERRKLKEQFDGPKLPREKPANGKHKAPNGLPCAACGAWANMRRSVDRDDPDLLCGICSQKAAEGVIVYVDGEWKPAELPSLAPPLRGYGLGVAEEFRQLPTLANRRKSTDQVLSTATPSGIAHHAEDVAPPATLNNAPVASLDPEVSPPYRTLGHHGRRKPAGWINEMSPRYRLVIDPEFRDRLPPLTDEQRARLKSDIVVNGCLQPGIAWWDGERLLLADGHHRWEICQELDTWFEILTIDFADRGAVLLWMDTHQRARRNVTSGQLAAWLEREKEARKNGKATGGVKAAEVVSKAAGVSPATVKRAAAAEKAKEKIAKVTGRSKSELDGLAREEAQALAALPADVVKQAFAAGRNAVRSAARKAATNKKAAKRSKRPRLEWELRREAEKHILRYLGTIADESEAWRLSEYLLDALNTWRGHHKPRATKSTKTTKRKPR